MNNMILDPFSLCSGKGFFILLFRFMTGINVMAEIDVPGPGESWGIGYPDLWSSTSCKEPLDVSKNFTFEVLSGILQDMREIFPFELFHLGGNEVNTGHMQFLKLPCLDIEPGCRTQWGHDFRPDYKNLGILKTQFPNATTTKKVQMDLVEMQNIPKCVKFVSTVNRSNLFYMVRQKSSIGKLVFHDIADFIQNSYSINKSEIVF
ncbi:hypothetical protein L1887_39722 [Cichorium endivia]|nr:hypothetical protein L1887_39722 [Cichorium endivia]